MLGIYRFLLHLILGTDFLQIHKAILNFDDHNLTLDEDIITSLSIKSDTQDLLSLTDLTKLKAEKTAMVKVKTPSRFNRKTIMVSPIKPFLREGLIVERSINQPDKCGVYVMLINVSQDCIYLPRGMNIAYGEVVDDWNIRAITDAPPGKLHNVFPAPKQQTNVIDFTGTSQHDANLKSLSANAKPFTPKSTPAMEIMTPSKEQKIEILEKLGLNLKECKIDEQTMISLKDLLYEYHPATIAEVSALLSSSPDTSCDLDPISTSLLKQCKSVLLPTITNIINLSLSTGVFPDQFKNCSVHPLLKNSSLDKENLSNYRPISHLSYLSKLTERLVKNRLADHLNENNLMNSFQSAYTKFNSTETTLLAVHDHIIRAMSASHWSVFS